MYLCMETVTSDTYILIVKRDPKVSHLYSEEIIKILGWENFCSSIIFKFLFLLASFNIHFSGL